MTTTPSEEQELREQIDHITGNCFNCRSPHDCFYDNLPIENTELEDDEAISAELVRFTLAHANAKVSAMLDDLEKQIDHDLLGHDLYVAQTALQTQRNKLTNKKEGKS